MRWLRNMFRPRPVTRFTEDEAREEAVKFIAAHEGYRGTAYQCPAKRWTVGFGMTRIYGRAVREGDRVDRAEAMELLRTDVSRRWVTMRGLLPSATPDQLIGWVSLAFNAGTGDVAGSRALRYFKKGDMASCWAEFGGERGWTKVDGIPLEGLKKRRREEWAYIAPEEGPR